MPLQYKIPPFATKISGESDTEQEHLDSCDINKMIKNAHRGLQVRGSSNEPIYGYDDTTMTKLQLLQEKQRLESELTQIAEEHEFMSNELTYIPPEVRKKFKFKEKKAEKAQNDDKTTKQGQNPASKQNLNTNPPKPSPTDPPSDT